MTTPSPLLTRLSEIKAMADEVPDPSSHEEMSNYRTKMHLSHCHIVPALVEFARVAVEALDAEAAISDDRVAKPRMNQTLQTLTAILAQTKTK